MANNDIQGKLFMPNDNNDLSTGVSFYAIFAQNHPNKAIYADRAKHLAKTIQNRSTATLSHKDFGCLSACMLFYAQCVKVNVDNHKGDKSKEAKLTKKLNHVMSLYKQFMNQFIQTVSAKNRLVLKILIETKAPIEKIWKIQ